VILHWMMMVFPVFYFKIKWEDFLMMNNYFKNNKQE